MRGETAGPCGARPAAPVEGDGFYRAVYHAAPARLHVVDTEGCILSVSDAWLDALGYARDEVVGRPLTDFVAAPWRQRPASSLVAALLTSDRCHTTELQLVRKDGGVIDVLLTAAPELADADRGARAIVAVADITAREQAEDERRRKLLQEARRSSEELQQFAYIASHDLQEPLRMVSSFCGLLQQRYGGQLTEEANEFLDMAVDGALRMKELINGLRDYSRIQTRGQALAPADSEAALARALRQLQGAIEQNGALVTHARLPEVMGDPSQLTQLFQNLVGNAIKFHGEAAPEVHIEAKRAGDHWRFEVRDNSIGIEERHKERIFQIFQRLHARDQYPGIGIGLALCSRIVERHGGRLWVESAPGKGSRFCFTLDPVLEGKNA